MPSFITLKGLKPATLTAALLAATFMTSAAHAQNVLVNGDFEANAAPNWGNNTSVIPSGWSFQSGTSPNVVRVDGPGGQATWYTSGPDSDASNAAPGIARQYLDTVGSGSAYQVFTPQCSGEVSFGGAFSNRGGPGRGTLSLRRGAGTDGAVVGQTSTVNVSAGSPVGRPWQTVDNVASIQAGQTFSFVVTMTNATNFDEGYVSFTDKCDPEPTDPFTPPPPGTVGGDLGVIQNPYIPDPIVFPPVPNGEHYQCYMLEKGNDVKREQITIKDQFGRDQVVLGRPVMLCNPSEKIHGRKTFKIQDAERHLVCYTYLRQKQPDAQELRIQTQFGQDEVISTRREMFCAPAGKSHIKPK